MVSSFTVLLLQASVHFKTHLSLCVWKMLPIPTAECCPCVFRIPLGSIDVLVYLSQLNLSDALTKMSWNLIFYFEEHLEQKKCGHRLDSSRKHSKCVHFRRLALEFSVKNFAILIIWVVN
jgi:hypothetical protein